MSSDEQRVAEDVPTAQPVSHRRGIIVGAVIAAVVLVAVVGGWAVLRVNEMKFVPNPVSTLGKTGESTTNAAPSEDKVVQGDPEPLEDGLYVSGLRLTEGVSKSKVIDKLGTEDERYGEPSSVSYVWDSKDSRLTVAFDEVGSLQSATLSSADNVSLDESTFAFLDGKRVRLGESTLGEVMKWFSWGELKAAFSGEGNTLRDYDVAYGGEGSEQMEFGIRWDGTKNTTQQKRIPVTCVMVGYLSEE